jgi:hypothetical protein
MASRLCIHFKNFVQGSRIKFNVDDDDCYVTGAMLVLFIGSVSTQCYLRCSWPHFLGRFLLICFPYFLME